MKIKIKLDDHEEWRYIPGYEGKYQASSLGRIKSVDRLIMRSNGERLPIKGRVLKPRFDKCGRACVTVCGVTKRVHRLIAKTFIPNPDNKPQINHIDSNPSNNAVSNLEWCTRSENMLHAFKFGHHSHEGERHNRRKLSKSDVLYIREHPEIKLTQLAKKYNVTSQCIYSIRNNKTWRNL